MAKYYNNMSPVVAIPKIEYEALQKKARAYEELAGLFFRKAKEGSVGDIVEDFRKTNLYSVGFLRDLKAGLEQSSLRARK